VLIGGTAISGFELCDALGATIHEFAAIIELPDLGPGFPSPHPGVKTIRKWDNGARGGGGGRG
jgi:adenine/guanine phosphoribosyltransferase-like PRPP-binding protein